MDRNFDNLYNHATNPRPQKDSNDSSNDFCNLYKNLSPCGVTMHPRPASRSQENDDSDRLYPTLEEMQNADAQFRSQSFVVRQISCGLVKEQRLLLEKIGETKNLGGQHLIPVDRALTAPPNAREEHGRRRSKRTDKMENTQFGSSEKMCGDSVLCRSSQNVPQVMCSNSHSSSGDVEAHSEIFPMETASAVVHVQCLGCMAELVVEDTRDVSFVRCAICRVMTPLHIESPYSYERKKDLHSAVSARSDGDLDLGIPTQRHHVSSKRDLGRTQELPVDTIIPPNPQTHNRITHALRRDVSSHCFFSS